MKINKIIKRFNPKKATEPDKIPVKMVKLATNIIDSHLKNITNNDLPRNLFSNPAKVQLNVLYRLQKYKGKDEKNVVSDNIIYSNFNYCSLVTHFCSCKSSKKIEKIQ